jgi:hypothetical protein
MEKLNKKTVYVGIELLGVDNGQVSSKAIQLLKGLTEDGTIQNFEVFLVDDYPLKETKKVVTDILYEAIKLKYLAEEVKGYVKPITELLSKILEKGK